MTYYPQHFLVSICGVAENETSVAQDYTVSATSEKEAIDVVTEKWYELHHQQKPAQISARPHPDYLDLNYQYPFERALPDPEIEDFFIAWLRYLNRGMSLLSALDEVAKRAHPALKIISLRLDSLLSNGYSLAQALRAQPLLCDKRLKPLLQDEQKSERALLQQIALQLALLRLMEREQSKASTIASQSASLKQNSASHLQMPS